MKDMINGMSTIDGRVDVEQRFGFVVVVVGGESAMVTL